MIKYPNYNLQNRGLVFPRNDRVLRPMADSDIMKGLDSTPIQELRRPLDGETKDCEGAEPREVTPIASYNWTNDKEPTIFVPGCPPIWQNRPTPFRLDRDSGVSFIDQNRHRVPQYPLLPLVLAVDHLSPDFDFPSIDIVTDRNNLRKLLRWVNGTISLDFRIDLQLSGSTVLFTRYESTKVEVDSGRLGFGRNFEQYTTKRLAGCESSTGHHRIIIYDFGNLKLLVRFEVDACLHNDTATQDRRDRPEAMRPIPGDKPQDILAALRKMSIRSDDKIEIVSRGVLVPQSSLIELSTKSARGMELEGIDWQEYFPQLFLSQTPHHHLGVHEKGYFRRIDAHALNDSVLSVQQQRQQPAFDKLHVLLQKIKELVIAHGEDARLSLVYRVETKKLEVFSRKASGGVLPDMWLERFKPAPQETKNSEDESGPATRAIESDDPDTSKAAKQESDESDDEKLSDYDSDGSSDALNSDEPRWRRYEKLSSRK
ncbi:hypothetical protein ACEPAF_9402 [Sanghuangporus sanghuang]